MVRHFYWSKVLILLFNSLKLYLLILAAYIEPLLSQFLIKLWTVIRHGYSELWNLLEKKLSGLPQCFTKVDYTAVISNVAKKPSTWNLTYQRRIQKQVKDLVNIYTISDSCPNSVWKLLQHRFVSWFSYRIAIVT